MVLIQTRKSGFLRLLRLRGRQARRWALRTNLWGKLEAALLVSAICFAMGSYYLLGHDGALVRAVPSHVVNALIFLTVLPVFGLAILVGRRLLAVFARRRRGVEGSRLHVRLVGLFSLLAVIPTLLAVGFTSLMFQGGLQFWFSERVGTAVENADLVAQAYVEENTARIRGDLMAMAFDLNEQHGSVGNNVRKLAELVEWQVLARDLTEAVVFTVGPQRSMQVLARVQAGNAHSARKLPQEAVARAAHGAVVVAPGSGEQADRVQALIKLNNYENAYLYISRRAATRVLDQVARIETALSDYQSLTLREEDMRLRFNLALAIVSVLILLTAIIAALVVANQLVTPISRMVRAATRVGRGDLSARVTVRDSRDELAQLGRAFNRMTEQLAAQTGALKTANMQLDDRRRFTEAVLSSVSGGILGVDARGVITLPNLPAAELLDTPIETLGRARLIDVAPEFEPALVAARQAADGRARATITLERPTGGRTLMVQVSPVADRSGGSVLAFDDITQQLADQRLAAWSDVARRIAHEIKNPLTPIQLSAERLRRRYLKESSDPETFAACTDTIVRQVGDLRRMVDEFSSFARLPRPVFRPENLVEVIRQSLLLQEIANPGVSYTLTTPHADWLLWCDRSQITQALTNLLKNAAEAMAEARREASGGKAPPQIQIVLSALTLPDEEGTQVAITDTGPGLPPGLKDRLTEPYVTTRDRGAGLGLAIVRKIVEDHGGELLLGDAPTGGACMTLRFWTKALDSKRRASERDADGT